ncbi:MAG TPA: HAMP domain-containing sensor histidine kinase [Verrucomicrobiae bacterium]|jgi:signal transduction histidine kinase|nr:HAMP domain-containing sensor histidine kinase [Verrucomicrobiae bacterium]
MRSGAKKNGLRWKVVAALAIGLTLLVLAAAVLCSTLYLRGRMREEIVQRNAEFLSAVFVMQVKADQEAGTFTGPAGRPESYFDQILEISRLKGVMAVRLFDGQGRFVNAFPSYITEAALAPGDLTALQDRQPVSHYHPREDFRDLDLLRQLDETPAPEPVLEATIPLVNRNVLVGAAQFVMEGESVTAAFAQLDSHLIRQGQLIFVFAGGFLALVLTLAFERIDTVNRRLYEANQELALAARTNAVGAIASHLIHGLRNPLSAMQSLIERNRGRGAEADWQHAAASTQRMQALINEVLGILRDQDAVVHYELSLEELRDLICARIGPAARAAGIEFEAAVDGTANLSNRDASLVRLILENLAQNAIEATPKGKLVRLEMRATEKSAEFSVSDQGGGVPAEVLDILFQPCRSTKPGGGGIGLAICRQLATQIGASLELKKSTPLGSVFCLLLARKGAGGGSAPETAVV